MEEIETQEVTVSDGTRARAVIAKFTPLLSPEKQQEEWRYWIQFYHAFGDFFAEDIRILEELLDKEKLSE